MVCLRHDLLSLVQERQLYLLSNFCRVEHDSVPAPRLVTELLVMHLACERADILPGVFHDGKSTFFFRLLAFSFWLLAALAKSGTFTFYAKIHEQGDENLWFDPRFLRNRKTILTINC